MEKSAGKNQYSIGDISKQYDISIKTLHYYDEIGLLKPQKRNDQNGYRYYTNDEIGTLLTIKYYQETGLSLEKIKTFLGAKDLSTISNLFQDALDEKDQEIQRLTIAQESLLAWKNLIVEGEMYLKKKDIPFQIKKMPEIHTLSEGYIINDTKQRKRISLKQKSVNTKQFCYGALFREIESIQKLLNKEPSFCFNHMEIHPLSFQNIDSSKLGEYIILSGIHKGNNETILSTYKAMIRYAKKEHLSLTGSAIERYIIDASTIPNPNFHVTEIMLPIESI